jgi:ribosomal protein S18 acetylase RimI-like enzyme
LSQSAVGKRYLRSYTPIGLMVIKGPKEKFSQGSRWTVGDKQGYAKLLLMRDSRAYYKNTLYIEQIEIKKKLRGRGYGRKLYQKVENFARNLGIDFIQLDSEREAVGFWHKIGFKDLNIVYYQNKTAMLKKL